VQTAVEGREMVVTRRGRSTVRSGRIVFQPRYTLLVGHTSSPRSWHYHLRYPRNVVIATADESNQCLPGVLSHDPYPSKLRRPFSKVWISCRPLLVQFRQVRLQIEIVLNQILRVILILFSVDICNRYRWRGRSYCCGGEGFGRINSTIVKVS
jgi:hypothetical protein